LAQLGLHRSQRNRQALEFTRNLLGRDPVAQHIALARFDDPCAPDDDAAADSRAVQAEHVRYSSSKPEPISARSAATASASSGPSASIRSMAPRAAASIITPMMLLAF